MMPQLTRPRWRRTSGRRSFNEAPHCAGENLVGDAGVELAKLASMRLVLQ